MSPISIDTTSPVTGPTELDPAALDPAALDPAALDDLRAVVLGPVLDGGDPRAAEEVATFNLAVRHRPTVVVGATCAGDVSAAVRFAVSHDLPLAVHATGHGPVRPADGALVLSTSRMSGVQVDPDRGTATVGAGARWSDVLAAAQPHGLTAVAGSSSQVGAVGFSLGGGLGPLSRQYGFGADQVLAVELVGADARVRRVDAVSEPDLFWAVRGGKGNFGVVTSMEVRLVPVPSMYAGALFFAGESARDVLHSFRAWATTLPERTSASVALLNLPPLEELPEPIRGRYVVMLRFAHNGGDVEGAQLLAPMREAGRVVLDGVGRIDSSGTDVIHQDPTDPMPVWEHGALLRELPAPAVDALLEAAGPGVAPSLAMVELRLMGGAIGRPARVPNAVAGREGAFSLLTLGVLAPDCEHLVVDAGRRVHRALGPWVAGTSLLNWLSGEATPEQVAACWSPEVHRRLLEVKRSVDPGNLFRHGHALAP